MAVYGQGSIAELDDVQGNVLVNQGESTTAAQRGMGLGSGDLLVTREASSALIRFADECEVNVPSNLRVDISEAASCCIRDEDTGQAEVSADRIAVVDAPQGSVNRLTGENVLPAVEDSPLAVGDQVVTGPDSSVIIKYALGCEITLGPNQALTVQFAEECCLGAALVDTSAPLGGEVIAGGTAGTQLTGPLLIGGTAAVIGGVIVANDDDDGPVSAE